MSSTDLAAAATSVSPPQRQITVLLVDDQPIVAEAVRRMLAPESDVALHYCQDPTRAIAEANTLQPTVILQDLVMPDLDGLTLVKFFRANPATREVPLIVLSTKEEPTIKAEAFGVGANDYLVKLPDRLELVARVRYHSKGYIAQLERNEAYRALAESRRLLADEVAEAAKYVRSLLPAPLTDGPVRVDWRFVPSTQLGGDSFSYHWLDDDHFALFLLDVSGHGVGSSLMSVSALNILRSQALPHTDFRDPGQVLAGLNAAFDMEHHDNKFFTIWYGVYRPVTRQLTFAGGGHPPGLLLSRSAQQGLSLTPLESQGPMIGMLPDEEFPTQTVELPPAAKLLIFSDGVFEIDRADGTMWTFEDFQEYLATLPPDAPLMDRLLQHAQALHGSDQLTDDFSIVQAEF
ncbi:MAG: SpoIIE family protein phosphatase [Pirellulaceae bacterium]|nr:SpoIIE family protein phosphatase [Pirellulaceae bacterium]